MSVLTLVATLFVCVLLWKLSRSRKSCCAGLALVPGPQKDHWFTGNLQRLFKDGLEYNLGLFRNYGSVVKVHGMLGTGNLLVADPRALHHIVVKEQDIYQETDMFLMTNRLVFGEGLISTLGEQHRKQRKMLNPVFSLANMRALLPTIQPIANTLFERLRAELPEDGSAKEVDILPWMARGTLEYVGRAVLGISLDTLDPTETNEHADAIRRVSHAGLKAIFLRPFVPLVMRTLPPYWRNKLVDWLQFAFPALKELREISNTLDRCARRVLLEKRAAMEKGIDSPDPESDESSNKKDLTSIMLKANRSTSEKERLTDEELMGQINTLLLGGQETSTSALARILYILAREPQAQAHLRAEVRKAKREYVVAHDIEDAWEAVSLPYDVLMGLPYLDAVLRETLRVHPPTNMLNRTVTRDAVLPLEFPIRSTAGDELEALTVPAGTNIIISILGANHHTGVWGPDASVWRPERWLTTTDSEDLGLERSVEEESAENRKDGTPGCRNGVRFPGVYSTMMTFLGGGRACIGFKFAEMEIKQVIATLVSLMHFSLPSAMNEDGVRKQVYWRMDVLQVPVVRPPHGDLQTAQAPLDIRLLQESDFECL